MRLRLLASLMLSMFLSGITVPMAAAQTPAASPVGSGWQVTDVRQIDVDGEPIVLSPDGQWLAGTTDDGDAVCAWDVETLAQTCADLDVPVRPALGGMALRWAPDSSAFAFATGDIARLIRGNVMVFDVEAGEFTRLTDADDPAEGPLYIGADWTADSAQVVFAAFHGFGDQAQPDALYRADRNGGDLVEIPLPSWSDSYSIYFPPQVAGDAVLVSIQSKGEAGGVWRVGLDGSDPVQMVASSGPDAVSDPLVVAVARDGRYASIVSVTGLQRLEPEGTFHILDLASGELMPLGSERDLGFVAFAPGSDIGLTVLDDRLATIDPATGAAVLVANSPEVDQWLMHIPAWAADNTVFLPDDGGGTLVSLAPAG